jgi:hypothetical protein
MTKEMLQCLEENHYNRNTSFVKVYNPKRVLRILSKNFCGIVKSRHSIILSVVQMNGVVPQGNQKKAKNNVTQLPRLSIG